MIARLKPALSPRRLARQVNLYAHLLFNPAYLSYHLRLKARHANPEAANRDRRIALEEAVAWLYRSQDAGTDDGSRCFRLQGGWSACYPEVTGYIITTLFDHFHLTGKQESYDRAVRMADWLLTIQMDCGGFEGGYSDSAPEPIVFNTGQIIRGLVRTLDETKEEVYRDAVRRAADWLVEVQDADGAWRRHCYLNSFRVTDTRIAFPLLHAWQSTGNSAYRDAAARSVRHVMTLQYENGWFPHCDNSEELLDQPNTHTLAYTTRGLIESGLRLEDDDMVAAGQRCADAMLRRFEVDRVLYGRFDARWKPTVKWVCLTGCAQISKSWMLLYQHEGDPRYLNAALKINDYLCVGQDVKTPHPGMRGAIAGSEPLGGQYQPYAFPSWATKFYCDSLIIERRVLAALDRSTSIQN